jgi:hypothetical protein
MMPQALGIVYMRWRAKSLIGDAQQTGDSYHAMAV